MSKTDKTERLSGAELARQLFGEFVGEPGDGETYGILRLSIPMEAWRIPIFKNFCKAAHVTVRKAGIVSFGTPKISFVATKMIHRLITDDWHTISIEAAKYEEAQRAEESALFVTTEALRRNITKSETLLAALSSMAGMEESAEIVRGQLAEFVATLATNEAKISARDVRNARNARSRKAKKDYDEEEEEKGEEEEEEEE